MKRCVLVLLTLTVLTVVALLVNDRINVALVTASSGNAAYKTHRLFVQTPRSEIPILGSSRASSNYISTELSPIAFNYGIDGSGMYETLTMLKRALENPHPNPILVNLDPWGFHNTCRPSFQGDYRLALASPEVRAFLPQGKYDWSDRVPGFRFYGSFRSNLTTWLNSRLSVTKIACNGALLNRLSRTPEEWAIINARITDQTFSYHPTWRAMVHALPATAKHPIIWVVGPIAPHWREHYHGRDAMEAFLAEQAARPHTYVINLFDATANYTEAAFVDPTHLNLSGAEQFTHALRACLLSLPIEVFPR